MIIERVGLVSPLRVRRERPPRRTELPNCGIIALRKPSLSQHEIAPP